MTKPLKFRIVRHLNDDILHEGDLASFVEVAQKHGYTQYERSSLGYPLLADLYGPMFDGGWVRYEDAMTYEILST